jgi:hypothetical protein
VSKEPLNKFFLGLQRKNGTLVGYRVSTDPAAFAETSQPERPTVAVVTSPPGASSDFGDVFNAFVGTMESYRKFIPLTLAFAPFMSFAMADKTLGDFANSKGKKRAELSNDETAVYELDIGCHREFTILTDQLHSAREGVKRLPEIMVVGLISSYDAFLTDLLKVVLNKQGETLFTSDKTLTFSDLFKFSTMEDAKRSLIDKEIETVIRSSHHDQFRWMESKFDVKLREGLAIWPRFIELCERRNVLTHNGGVASNQYLVNCRTHKVDVTKLKEGDMLPVGIDYFSGAVGVIYEIGIKLCYVLWRKFSKRESNTADCAVNELCFNLIHGRAYGIAEAILRFSVNGFQAKREERTLSMMTINLANAIRLQNREDEATLLLNSKDWSAASRDLKLGVAAVKGDIDGLTELMKGIGNSGNNAEHYRTWPVFRGWQSNSKFTETFESIFGEPLIIPRSTNVDQISASAELLTPGLSDPPPMKH